jgi:hypothetical protein
MKTEVGAKQDEEDAERKAGQETFDEGDSAEKA